MTGNWTGPDALKCTRLHLLVGPIAVKANDITIGYPAQATAATGLRELVTVL
jgi:hypothetical protein